MGLFIKHIKTIAFAIAAVLALAGCHKDDEIQTRHFRMGFSPSAYEVSPGATGYVYDKLETEADIISHRFDNGVPWTESLNGSDYDKHIMDDWAYRKSKTNPSKKTVVSVTPLNFSRDGLANDRGVENNMPLAAPWDTYKFDDENIKTAYLNYCKRIIDFFQPDYFGMAIESNLLYMMNPDVWSDYLHLHEFIYRQLKSLYPDLPVFSSVAGAPMLKDFLVDNDHVQQRLAVMQLLQFSDYYALSFYPHLSAYKGGPYPENTFNELFSMSSKPVIVAETGYTAETFSMDAGAGSRVIETDPLKQQKFVSDLLAASEKWKAKFVIYTTLRDYDPLWTGSSANPEIARREAGLYDENGNPRPALNSWREYFKRKVAE